MPEWFREVFGHFPAEARAVVKEGWDGKRAEPAARQHEHHHLHTFERGEQDRDIHGNERGIDR